jgi:hypothetical protein
MEHQHRIWGEAEDHLQLMGDQDNSLFGKETLDAVVEDVFCCVVIHGTAHQTSRILLQD